MPSKWDSVILKEYEQSKDETTGDDPQHFLGNTLFDSVLGWLRSEFFFKGGTEDDWILIAYIVSDCFDFKTG